MELLIVIFLFAYFKFYYTNLRTEMDNKVDCKQI